MCVLFAYYISIYFACASLVLLSHFADIITPPAVSCILIGSNQCAGYVLYLPCSFYSEVVRAPKQVKIFLL